MTLFRNAYFLAVATLTPLLHPSLPLNTVILDYVNLFFLFLFFGFISLTQKPLEIRLLIPFLIMLAGSFISMLDAQALGANLVAIVQDIYLFLFFLLLYNMIDNERHARTLVLSWIIVSALEGALAMASVAGHFSLTPSPDLTRAQGTFESSNMAASYLAISFFLVFQPYVRVNVFWKIAAGLLIFGGMFATKSLSAALGFLIGNFVVLVVYWINIGFATRVKLAITVLTIMIAVLTVLPQLTQTKNFLERSPRSAQDRFDIWKPAYRCFINHPFGIGPGAFVVAGGGPFNVSGPPDKKGTRTELHNDYLASLVERGIVGFIGHMFLLGTIASMLLYCVKQAHSDQDLLWALGLCGMFCFILVDALNHEGLHYRHVWLAFALIAIQEKVTRRLTVTT